MSGNFNWNTDEEYDWDEDEPVIEERMRWRPPKWLAGGLIVFMALSAVSYLVFRSVSGQVEEIEEDVALTVLDSVALTQQAGDSGDIELFTSLLSGREQDWSNTQRDLVRAGLWLSRPQLGLTLVAPAGQHNNAPHPTDADVTLNPALQSAEITLTHLYESDIGNGLTEIIALEQTVVYRQGETSWLFAPPEESFWGERTTFNSLYFDVSYQVRDEAIVQRLVRDLDDHYGELCRSRWINKSPTDCSAPEELLTLDFVNTPELMLLLERQRFELRARTDYGGTFPLPTPSLIGLPTDEASYQALFRGYATLLFSWIIQDAAGYICCEHQTFFEATLRLQLNQISVQSWPLGESQYRQLLREMPTRAQTAVFGEFSGIDEISDPEWIYALVMYQSFQRGLPLNVMQQRLSLSSTIEEWLTLPDETTAFVFDESFYENWRRFLYGQTNLARQPMIPTSSEESLILNCFDRRRSTPNATVLTQLKPGSIELQDISFFSSSMFMVDMPGDKGLILHEGVLPVADLVTELRSPDAGRTILWQNGSERTLNSAPIGAPRLTFNGNSDPNGQRLIVQSDQFKHGVIDLTSCAPGCSATPLESDLVRWSPDGTKALQSRVLTTAQGTTTLLWLSDGALEGRQPLPDGTQPFWVTNDRYGYFEGQNLVVTSLSNPADIQRLELEIERPESPIDNSPLPLEVTALVQNPADRHDLLILFSELSRGRQFLLRVKSDGTNEELLFDSTFAPNEMVDPFSLGYSTTGEWLKYSLSDGQAPAMLYFYHLNKGLINVYDLPEATTLGHDWSLDSAWLAINRGIYIQLISLTTDEQWLIELGVHLNCSQVVWQNSSTD